MKRRNVEGRIAAALRDTPVVFLQGPRQSGKTTLALQLRDTVYDADYLTFDDATTFAAANSDAEGFVAGLPDRVILDEVQRVPDLFRAIKRSVDLDRRPGRFVLTGSAHALAAPQAAEALVGRMEIITLWPFSQGEMEEHTERFVDKCFTDDFHAGPSDGAAWQDLLPRIVRGGYPEAVSRLDSERRRAWFGSYVTTILERDIRDLAQVQGLRDMPRLLRLCAARSAGLLNFAELARDAAMPNTTLQRYWALFQATFLVWPLPAWSANLGSRLVKSPKVFLHDTGLLCSILGLDEERLSGDDLMSGPVLESFVVSELTKQIGWSRTQPAMHHYRTHAQQEVDVVLEEPSGRIVAIEVKRSASPTARDFSGLRHLQEQAGDRFVRGILLYTGANAIAFGDRLHAVPISALWQSTAAGEETVT